MYIEINNYWGAPEESLAHAAARAQPPQPTDKCVYITFGTANLSTFYIQYTFHGGLL